jgi:hypothetical protein
MVLNEATWDRAARGLAGIAMISAGVSGFVAGNWAAAVEAVGAVFVVTAAIGWCPAYSLFRFSTKRTHPL